MKRERRAPEIENPRHSRARNHLEKILKTTALATVALNADACRCHPIVCDPMPPPLSTTCPTSQEVAALGLLESKAWWTSGDAGPLAVAAELTLDEAKAKAAGKVASFGMDPVTPDGSLSAVNCARSRLTFTLAPNPGVSRARVRVFIECDVPSLTHIVDLGFDLSAPSPGAPVTVAIEP